MKSKEEKFKKIIKLNREVLETKFGYNVVYSWSVLRRYPNEQNAKIISGILGLPLSEIPYYRTEHVI